MFDDLRTFIKRVGVKLGLIKELNLVTQHRKVSIEDKAYERINLNKQIYQGYIPKWHDLTYITSNGVQKKRRMLSLGIGKIVAKEMANIIFNEKCSIDVSPRNGKDKDVKEFINQVLSDNGFYRNFERYLEYCYALGGMAVKVYQHDGKIKLAYSTADAMYPLSNDSENIDEALFIYQEKKDKKYYSMLEWNEWKDGTYVITNELYESDDRNKLGHKVPLSTLYEDLDEVTRITNITRPLFVYFKPNTANNKDMQSPLGISLFENSHDTIYSIDYIYDFFMHEFKLGKRRIAVDHSMLKEYIDSDGNMKQRFDTDETVFVPLSADDSIPVTDLSVGLRTSDIISAINAQLDLLAMQVGFSTGTFTFDGTSVRTATEIVSVNSKTFRTKNSHEMIVSEGIKNLVKTILEVANLYGIYNGTSDVDVAVDFDDSIAQDRQQNYNYYSMAVNDKLIPRLEAIQRIFKITEQEAEEWIARIDSNEMTTESALDLIGVPIKNLSDE